MRHSRCLTLALFSATWLFLGGAAHATILNFNIDNVAPPGSPATSGGSLTTTHAAYGDNVTATAMTVGSFVYNYGMGNGFTPNVTVAYSLGAGATASNYYTDGDAAVSPIWKDVNFLIGGAPAIHYYTFTPNAPEFGVKVNSFDVFGYSANLNHTFQWKLRADNTSGTILASGGPHVLTTSTIAAPFTVTTGQDFHFGTLVLEVDHTVGSGGAWGLDNLNFDQIEIIVPEPGTMGSPAWGSSG